MLSNVTGIQQIEASVSDTELLAELRAAFDAKVRRGIFKPVARFAPAGDEGADRLQDAICQTWETYRRSAIEKRRLLPDAVLVHCCRLRVIDLERRFVHGNYSRRNQDVFSTPARRKGDVELVHMLGADDPAMAQPGSPNPTRDMVSSMDLRAWLSGLSEPDCRVLLGRLVGETLGETAATVGLSVCGVFRRARHLGSVLAERAGVVIEAGKSPRQSAATAVA